MNEIEVIAELLLGESKQVIRYDEIERYEISRAGESKIFYTFDKQPVEFSYNTEYIVHMRLYAGKLKLGRIFLETYPDNFISGLVVSTHNRYNSIQVLEIITLIDKDQVLYSEKTGKGAR